MRVFVTGASGFVGRAVVREALGRSWDVVALVHRRGAEDDPRITLARTDLFDSGALAEAMRGCDAVIHLVGIIRERASEGVTFERLHHEATRCVVGAAEMAGVKRYIQMSALGARADAPSAYHRTKFAGEERVRASRLEWTILRPSMIVGAEGEFMRMAAGWARGAAAPWLFMPYFGRGVLGMGGAGKLQPVRVEDVARAFVDAVERAQTIGRTCDLVGPEVFTWPELHRAIARAVVGKARAVVAIPAWYAKLLTRVAPAALLPFNREQVLMSQEDNMGDGSAFARDFGWSPPAVDFSAATGEGGFRGTSQAGAG